MSDIISETTHDRLQAQCFQWAHNTYPEVRGIFFSVPNEQELLAGKSRQQKIMILTRMKSIGHQPGVYDLLLYWKGVLYGFDIKVGKDRESDVQGRFREKVVKNGGKCYLIPDFGTFMEIFEAIMAINYKPF